MTETLVFLLLLLLLVYSLSSGQVSLLVVAILLIVVSTDLNRPINVPAARPEQRVPIQLTPTPTLVPQTAPDFAVRSLSNKLIRLSDYTGQVVVLNFWASWCAPCREQLLTLNTIAGIYAKRDVTVIGVAYFDTQQAARTFIEQSKINFEVIWESKPVIASQYRIKGVPETYIINQRGQIVDALMGSADAVQISAILERLLLQKP